MFGGGPGGAPGSVGANGVTGANGFAIYNYGMVHTVTVGTINGGVV